MSAKHEKQEIAAIPAVSAGPQIQNENIILFDSHFGLETKVGEETSILWSIRLSILNRDPGTIRVKVIMQLTSSAHTPILQPPIEFDLQASEQKLIKHETTDRVRYTSTGSVNEIGTCLIEWADQAGNAGNLDPPISEVLAVTISA
jgi:hypothetical protein